MPATERQRPLWTSCERGVGIEADDRNRVNSKARPDGLSPQLTFQTTHQNSIQHTSLSEPQHLH